MHPHAALPEASPKDHGEGRPETDTLTVSSSTTPRNGNTSKTRLLSPNDADQPLHTHGQRRRTAALEAAPLEGATVADLMQATGMGRSWVYYRLSEHHAAGRAVQVVRGSWRAAPSQDPS